MIDGPIYNSQGRLYRQKSRVNDEATLIIEEKAKKIPNIGLFGLAMAGLVVSGILSFRNRKFEPVHFLGVCVPALLLVGIYNKIVKLEEGMFINFQESISEMDSDSEFK